jgi:SAM-dependent methyltransferase
VRVLWREAVVFSGCLAGVFLAAAIAAQEAEVQARRAIRLSDLAPALRERLPAHSLTEEGFAVFVRSLDRETAERERAGEYEHLVYYLLQSQRFTREPRIEPALSAYELVTGMDAEQRSRFLEGEAVLPPGARVPPSVLRRAADFMKALAGDPAEARLAHFKRFLAAEAAPEPPLLLLLSQYARAMRFLYRKEFVSRELEDPQELEAYLASLYRRRGHSTDTQVEANFAVHTALSVIRAYGDDRLDRVLIVGPGLDFAPRTDLLEAFEPQSYQPFAVADALLALGLSEPGRLRVHCVDISERVVRYLRHLAGGEPVRLQLVSGIPEREDRPLGPEFLGYFARLGRSIGEEGPLPLPGGVPRHLGKSLRVRPEIAGRITADRLNIVTERYDPSPSYDLVVVTNVFSYFDPAEQTLALSNIAPMLREGGYLIHNEPQSSLVEAARRLGLGMADARTVRLSSGGAAPLFDRVVIHRKALRPHMAKPDPTQ